MMSFDNVTKAFGSSLHAVSDSHSTCPNGCQPLYLELSCDLRGVVCMRMGTEGFFFRFPMYLSSMLHVNIMLISHLDNAKKY